MVRSPRNARLWKPPAATARTLIRFGGTAHWRAELSPHARTMPPATMARLCWLPAASANALDSPAGVQLCKAVVTPHRDLSFAGQRQRVLQSGMDRDHAQKIRRRRKQTGAVQSPGSCSCWSCDLSNDRRLSQVKCEPSEDAQHAGRKAARSRPVDSGLLAHCCARIATARKFRNATLGSTGLRGGE